MKLTLESQAVEVALDDGRFPHARIWKGHSADGTPVMALIACVEAVAPETQERLQASLAALPTQMTLTPRQTDYLFATACVA